MHCYLLVAQYHKPSSSHVAPIWSLTPSLGEMAQCIITPREDLGAVVLTEIHHIHLELFPHELPVSRSPTAVGGLEMTADFFLVLVLDGTSRIWAEVFAV